MNNTVAEPDVLRPLVNELYDKLQSSDQYGLWSGKMGLSVFMFHYARLTGHKDFERKASDLLDEVCENVNDSLSLSFSSGLLGIATSIEYLIQNSFIEGGSDELLGELDILFHNQIISRSNFENVNLKNGLCGLGYYLYYRLNKKRDDNENLITLKNKLNLVRWIDWLEDSLDFVSEEKDWDDVYYLMNLIHSLNIINFKVDKILRKTVLRFTLGWNNVEIVNNYEYLGIPLLKLLKPWI